MNVVEFVSFVQRSDLPLGVIVHDIYSKDQYRVRWVKILPNV